VQVGVARECGTEDSGGGLAALELPVLDISCSHFIFSIDNNRCW